MSDSSNTTYKVKSNEETIYTVSKLNGLLVEELLLLNGLNYDSTLTVGQELIVKSEKLNGSLLFDLEDYQEPDCSGCDGSLDNCGSTGCECACVVDGTNCSNTGPCSGGG